MHRKLAFAEFTIGHRLPPNEVPVAMATQQFGSQHDEFLAQHTCTVGRKRPRSHLYVTRWPVGNSSLMGELSTALISGLQR